jgi:phosphoglucomutase/phosphomannomutase
VFSPLHGAGKSCAARAMEAAGFNVIRVEEQWANDGDFPTVPGRVANPEEPPAMVLGAQKAKAVGADIFMATDPDADRMGAIAPDSAGTWHFIDGNQIGAILTHYILSTKKAQGALPPKPLVISTEVTTSILGRISAAFGARNINHLLVGFKYIGDILKQIDETGAFEGEAFGIDDYVFGTEESHGYLVTHAIRDKDSAGACLLLAELAAQCKAEGSTVIDYLNNIYSEFGFTRNLLISVGLAGAEGKDIMERMLNSYREKTPTEIGRYNVKEMLDLQDPEVRFGPIKSETDRAGRNVLVFHMQDGKKGVIRPSGTEPKTKIYFEATGQSGEGESLDELKASVDASLREFAQVFAEEMLRRGDITPDTPGVKVSGIEALDKKLKFAEFMEG